MAPPSPVPTHSTLTAMADYRRGRRRQLDASASSVVMRNVMERQLMRDAARRIKKTSKGAAFSGFSLQGALDTYDPETSKIKLSFLRKRSRVAEIIAAGELIFALTRHGVCAAFNRGTCRLPGPPPSLAGRFVVSRPRPRPPPPTPQPPYGGRCGVEEEDERRETGEGGMPMGCLTRMMVGSR